MQTKILAFSGYKGAGKTTLAKWVRRNSPEMFGTYNCHIFSFATPGKRFCVDYLGLSHASVFGSEEEKNLPTHIRWEDVCTPKAMLDNLVGPMTGREVLEEVCTGVIRKLNPGAFVSLLFKDALAHETQAIVIDDLRFPDEVDEVQRRGGKVIRLTRGTCSGSEAESSLEPNVFDQSRFDYCLDNNVLTLTETEMALVGQLRKWGWLQEKE